MTRLAIALATGDGRRVDCHAWTDGGGSLRDCNHATDCVRQLVGTDGAWSEGRPDGKRTLFEISLGIGDTRRGTSTYRGCDYRRLPGCPNAVAEAGMEIYAELKRVLRRARN